MKANIEFSPIQRTVSIIFYQQGWNGRLTAFIPERGGHGSYETIEEGMAIPESMKFVIPVEALESLVEEARKMSLGIGQLDGVVLDAFKRESDRVDRLLAYVTDTSGPGKEAV